jgi:hypothetical protein
MLWIHSSAAITDGELCGVISAAPSAIMVTGPQAESLHDNMDELLLQKGDSYSPVTLWYSEEDDTDTIMDFQELDFADDPDAPRLIISRNPATLLDILGHLNGWQ